MDCEANKDNAVCLGGMEKLWMSGLVESRNFRPKNMLCK